MTAAKTTQPAAAPASDIVRNAVLSVQSIAAYEAGFKADIPAISPLPASGKTGWADNNCAARRALRKLVALSPAVYAGRDPLTKEELHAKAAVLSTLTRLAKEHVPDNFEAAFVDLFGRETMSLATLKIEDTNEH